MDTINIEIENLLLKIGDLEMRHESLTNRIRILEADSERLKKAQLERYLYSQSECYSTAEESTEENEIYKECNNSDCSECEKDTYY